MKIIRKIVLVFILCAGIPLMSGNINDSAADDVQEIVDKTAQRVLSYPEMSHWKASVLSTMYDMDKKWKPKKTTVVEKTVLMKNNMRSESIIKAVEYKKGKSKDVTQKYINDAYKAREKAARERRKANKKEDRDGDDGADRHRREFSMDEMFPFSEKNRENYEFSLLEETNLEGVSVYVVDARARQRTKESFEGKFYIEKGTFDILRAELQLAKNPSAVKLMEMVMDFLVLPEGYFVAKKMYFRIHVGLVVKNIRREAVEEYSDYQILE